MSYDPIEARYDSSSKSSSSSEDNAPKPSGVNGFIRQNGKSQKDNQLELNTIFQSQSPAKTNSQESVLEIKPKKSKPGIFEKYAGKKMEPKPKKIAPPLPLKQPPPAKFFIPGEKMYTYGDEPNR